jgi:hypothetical protein
MQLLSRVGEPSDGERMRSQRPDDSEGEGRQIARKRL